MSEYSGTEMDENNESGGFQPEVAEILLNAGSAHDCGLHPRLFSV